jgi:hypothetical protein
VTAVALEAVPAVIVNVALVAPAGIVICVGTERREDDLVSVIEIPPTGAGPVRLTVPVPVRPLTMVVGVADRAESAGGMTVNVADALRLGPFAVTRTDVLALTALVVMVKVVLEVPAAMVTLTGTEAIAGVADWSPTTTPPVGAALPSRTVAVEAFPPATEVGESERDATSAASATGDDHVTIEARSVSRSARCFIWSVPQGFA